MILEPVVAEMLDPFGMRRVATDLFRPSGNNLTHELFQVRSNVIPMGHFEG